MTPSVIPNGNRVQSSIVPPLFSDHPIAVKEGASEENHSTRERCLLIIDNRALDRQCLAHCISELKLDMDVLEFASVEEWNANRDRYAQPAAMLLNIGSKRVEEPAVAEEVKRISSEFAAPVILLAEADDLSQIMKALEYGAKGYIPASVSINVCIEAISLSLAGGIFVPASSVFAMRQVLETTTKPSAPPLATMFTARQAEVVEALRRGKANKIIAYELNLRESTVKVHIRNIMKKVKATNRTEVAYKIRDLFPSEIPFDTPMSTM